MIPKEQLMIGDWVSFANISKTTVTELTHTYAELRGDDVLYDRIKPIPLTEEILEKNFYSNSFCYYLGTNKFRCQIEKHADKWILWVEQHPKAINVQIRIEYVHELQHALRLCGIQKEIEL